MPTAPTGIRSANRVTPVVSDVLRRIDPILVAILFLGLVLRVAYWRWSGEWVFHERKLRWPDERAYLMLAKSLARDGWAYFLTDDRASWVAPGNVIYVSVVRVIERIKALNVLASTATIALSYGIARRLSSHLTAARVAALLCAISPRLIQYAPTLLTEVPFTFLLAVWLYATIRGMESTRPARWFAAAGASLALASLVRATAQLLAPGLAVGFVAAALVTRRSWRSTTALWLIGQTVVVLMAALPFMAMNAWRGDGFKVANGLGAVVFLGSRQDTRGDDPPLVRRTYDTEKVCPDVHLTTRCDAALMAQGRRNIEESPWAFASLIPAKVARLWIGNATAYFFPGTGVLSAVAFRSRFELSFAMTEIVVATAIVVFMGMALVWPGTLVSEAHLLAFLCVGYFTAVHALSFALPRYGYPLVPVMAGLAARGLEVCGLVPGATDAAPGAVALRRTALTAIVLVAAMILFGWES